MMASASVTIDFTLPEQEIKISRTVLGEGACSRVFRATWRGAAVAIKCIRPDPLPGEHPSQKAESENRLHLLEALREELCTMCSLRHPNIVRLFGVYAPATHYVGLVMELMDTSLQCRTTAGPALTTPCLIHVLHDLTAALGYLHSRNILHRDISPRNSLLSEDSAQRRLVAKLSDFATAKAVDTIGFDRYSATSSQIGTLSYLPYEAIDKDPVTDKLVYSSAVDVYSVGAVGLFAALRKVPGGTPRAKPGFLRILGSSHVLHSVLKECLDDDPRMRPTSADLQIRFEKLTDLQVCRRDCLVSSTGAASDENCDIKTENSGEWMIDKPPIEPKSPKDACLPPQQRGHKSTDCKCAAEGLVKQLQTQLTVSKGRIHQLQQQLKVAEEQAQVQQRHAGPPVPPLVHRFRSCVWDSLQGIPNDGKYCHHTIPFGDWIVLAGGRNGRSGSKGEGCRRVYAYSITRRFWTSWPSTPNRYSGFTTDGQRLYAAGGSHPFGQRANNGFYRLDDSQRQWLRLPEMHFAVSPCAAAYHHHKVFVYGAHSDNPNGRLQVFDFSKMMWSVLPSPATSLGYQCQLQYSLVPWGNKLVSYTLRSYIYYNVQSDQWHCLPLRKAGETGCLAVFQDQLISVGSSLDNDAAQRAVDGLESLASEWLSLSSLPSPQHCASMCAKEGRLFVTGGMDRPNTLLCSRFT